MITILIVGVALNLIATAIAYVKAPHDPNGGDMMGLVLIAPFCLIPYLLLLVFCATFIANKIGMMD